MELTQADIDRVVAAALAEDVGDGDRTSEALVPADARCRAQLLLEEPGAVVAGLEVTGEVEDQLGVQLEEPVHEQVGLLLGVALGGLAGGVHQLPELRLVHHRSSIVPGAAPRTRSPPDADRSRCTTGELSWAGWSSDRPTIHSLEGLSRPSAAFPPIREGLFQAMPMDERTRADIERVMGLLGTDDPRSILRTKESVYRELGLADADRDQLLDAMAANPILIERPIVIRGDRAVVARPPDRVLELLGDE